MWRFQLLELLELNPILRFGRFCLSLLIGFGFILEFSLHFVCSGMWVHDLVIAHLWVCGPDDSWRRFFSYLLYFPNIT